MFNPQTVTTEREQEIQRECETLRATLIAKNKDYGNSSGMSPLFVNGLSAESALLIRMSDKVRRLDALLMKKDGTSPAVTNESIEDTLLDLAGYALLVRMERRKAQNPVYTPRNPNSVG